MIQLLFVQRWVRILVFIDKSKCYRIVNSGPCAKLFVLVVELIELELIEVLVK